MSLPSSWSPRRLLLLARAPSFWSSISTHFPHCEQSLTVAGACAGAVIVPLFIIDYLRSTLRAAARSSGVGCSSCPDHCTFPWSVCWPCPLVFVLVHTVGGPSIVLSLPSSSLILAALFLVLIVVVPMSLSLFHRGPCPCSCCLALVLVIILCHHPLLSSSSSYPPWFIISSSGWYLKKFAGNKIMK